jgi:hypothetical protein
MFHITKWFVLGGALAIVASPLKAQTGGPGSTTTDTTTTPAAQSVTAAASPGSPSSNAQFYRLYAGLNVTAPSGALPAQIGIGVTGGTVANPGLPSNGVSVPGSQTNNASPSSGPSAPQLSQGSTLQLLPGTAGPNGFSGPAIMLQGSGPAGIGTGRGLNGLGYNRSVRGGTNAYGFPASGADTASSQNGVSPGAPDTGNDTATAVTPSNGTFVNGPGTAGPGVARPGTIQQGTSQPMFQPAQPIDSNPGYGRFFGGPAYNAATAPRSSPSMPAYGLGILTPPPTIRTRTGVPLPVSGVRTIGTIYSGNGLYRPMTGVPSTSATTPGAAPQPTGETTPGSIPANPNARSLGR